jgi:molybdate transport system ATP-binding protein
LLADVAETASPRIILALREQDHIPSFITHILQLTRTNQILHNGPKPSRPILPPTPQSDVLTSIKSQPPPASDTPSIVELKNVNISYWGKPVLRNITWTIHPGSKWLLLGPNGSGKTTLLSLLTGDNPKSFAQDITLFGRRRGTGETIFDIQARIGHVSPEVHYHFPAQRTAREAVLSGFTGTFAPPGEVTVEQEVQYSALVNFFEDVLPPEICETRFRELSNSHQRLVLLLRAFVKEPTLLILDEPYQGMDEQMIQRTRDYLETQVTPQQAVIMVTHFVAEEASDGHWTHLLQLTDQGTIEQLV